MICEKCGLDHNGSFGSGRFCSRACANSRIHTKKTKEKISKTLMKNEKKFIKKGIRIKIERKFCSCGKLLGYGNKSGICKNCKLPSKTRSEIIKNFRRKRKLELALIKGGKCEICGYSKSLNSLHFHHKNQNEKKFGISTGNPRSLEEDIKEIEKCILVCANCHGELHDLTVNYILLESIPEDSMAAL